MSDINRLSDWFIHARFHATLQARPSKHLIRLGTIPRISNLYGDIRRTQSPNECACILRARQAIIHCPVTHRFSSIACVRPHSYKECSRSGYSPNKIEVLPCIASNNSQVTTILGSKFKATPEVVFPSKVLETTAVCQGMIHCLAVGCYPIRKCLTLASLPQILQGTGLSLAVCNY
jgi:hypothetical protein